MFWKVRAMPAWAIWNRFLPASDSPWKLIVPDVGRRDSAYYSVIDSEWPEVRANLRRRLAGTPAG